MDILLNTPTEFTILGVSLAAFAFLAWRRLDLAAAAVVFFAPSYILRIREPLPYPTNVLEILIWILFIVWFIKKISSHSERSEESRGGLAAILQSLRSFRMTAKCGYLFPAALIFLGAAISVFAGGREYFQASLGQFLVLFIEPVLFFIIARDVWKSDFRGKSGFRILLFAYIASATAVAFVSLVGILTPLQELFVTFDGRLRGFYLSPNHLAMYVVPAALLVIGLLSHWVIKRPGIPHIISLVFALIILLTTLYLTRSYGAWFGFLGGFIVFLLIIVRFSARGGSAFGGTIYNLRFTKQHLIIASFLILFLLGTIFLQEVGGARFQNVFDERGPWASRLMVWRVAFEILKDHPLWGIGLGTFQDYYLAYQQKFPPYLEWAVPQPHNLFLAVWLQAGILGLVGFSWLIIAWFRNAWKSDFHGKAGFPQFKIAIPAAVIAILLHGLIDTPIFKNDLALIFCLLVTTHAGHGPTKRLFAAEEPIAARRTSWA